MKSKGLQWAGFIGVAVCVAFSTILIFLPNDALLGSVQSASAILGGHIDSGIPVRLTIPKISVDAAIEPVGLTGEGAMSVPKGPDDTAWFSQGTRPGEIGSAVIDGHSGWKDGIPAVFDNLNRLRIGDTILVMDGRGVTFTFVVRKVKTYDPKADASDVFSSNDGKVHLNLITCEGTWDPISRTSSERLIVFADKE